MIGNTSREEPSSFSLCSPHFDLTQREGAMGTFEQVSARGTILPRGAGPRRLLFVNSHIVNMLASSTLINTVQNRKKAETTLPSGVFFPS